MNENGMTRELIALMNEGRDLQYILDRTVETLRASAGCEAVGIRVLDEHGNIPYMSYSGFTEDFIEKEGPLCVRRDKCACIYVTQGEYDPSLKVFTNAGSFYDTHLQELTLLKDGMKAGKFRGECVFRGWETLALVPVRFAHRYFGLIQLVDSRSDILEPEMVTQIEKVAGVLGLYMHAVQTNRDREKELAFLLRRVMHDLKQPLATASMFSDLILTENEGALDETVVDSIGRITNNLDYMSRLVSSLNVFSDAISPMDEEKEDISLGELASGMARDIAASANPGVCVKVLPGMPVVQYPELQLRRVLSNLVSNAIKFSRDNPSPAVEIGCVEKDRFWQVFVSDNGMGMDEDDVGKVFLPFFRSVGARKVPGTGLGLAICKKIVESHGGEIWVYSTEGEGSTFYFTIPKKTC